jgi:ATP/maltotriose-dependent transcriptional regulator MalT
MDPRDSIQSFFDQIAFSIRQVLPDFDFDTDSQVSKDPHAHMRALVDAARGVKEEINFVIDKGTIDNPAISKFGQALIDNLPENAHLILVRRQSPEYVLSRFASLGNYSVISVENLKFSESEVAAIAKINEIDLKNPEIKKLIDKCDGWPAAVQLLTRSIARSESSNLEIMDSNEPLVALTKDLFHTLSQDLQTMITKLSLVQEFDLEIAKVILEEDFSEVAINKLASDGLFLNVTSGNNRAFKLNKLSLSLIFRRNLMSSWFMPALQHTSCLNLYQACQSSTYTSHKTLKNYKMYYE